MTVKKTFKIWAVATERLHPRQAVVVVYAKRGASILAYRGNPSDKIGRLPFDVMLVGRVTGKRTVEHGYSLEVSIRYASPIFLNDSNVRGMNVSKTRGLMDVRATPTRGMELKTAPFLPTPVPHFRFKPLRMKRTKPKPNFKQPMLSRSPFDVAGAFTASPSPTVNCRCTTEPLPSDTGTQSAAANYYRLKAYLAD